MDFSASTGVGSGNPRAPSREMKKEIVGVGHVTLPSAGAAEQASTRTPGLAHTVGGTAVAGRGRVVLVAVGATGVLVGRAVAVAVGGGGVDVATGVAVDAAVAVGAASVADSASSAVLVRVAGAFTVGVGVAVGLPQAASSTQSTRKQERIAGNLPDPPTGEPEGSVAGAQPQ